jgi:MFS family permease
MIAIRDGGGHEGDQTVRKLARESPSGHLRPCGHPSNSDPDPRPKLVFPGSDPWVGTLQAFGVYFIGFVARPIGAAIFGHYGDRIGRKATPIVTLLMTGISTTAVGLVPGYATATREVSRAPGHASGCPAGCLVSAMSHEA